VSASGPDRSRRSRRYTIEFSSLTGWTALIRAVTPSDEAMAIALATARLIMTTPDAQIRQVRVVEIEAEFELDPEEDAIDYWNTN
jgi:hypothetical protein